MRNQAREFSKTTRARFQWCNNFNSHTATKKAGVANNSVAQSGENLSSTRILTSELSSKQFSSIFRHDSNRSQLKNYQFSQVAHKPCRNNVLFEGYLSLFKSRMVVRKLPAKGVFVTVGSIDRLSSFAVPGSWGARCEVIVARRVFKKSNKCPRATLRENRQVPKGGVWNVDVCPW